MYKEDVVYTHTHTYTRILFRHEKEENMLFASTLVDHEGMMLSEKKQTKTDII